MNKILIAGEGGQGIQLIAELLSRAAFLEHKQVLYIPNFGVEQRGGISLAFVTIDNKEVNYPKFKSADILAILCDRAFSRVNSYIDSKTRIVLGPAVSLKRVPNVSIDRLFFVKPSWFPPKVWNILTLATINNLDNLVSLSSLRAVMEEKLKNKFDLDPNLRELNLRALTSNKQK